MIDLRPVTRWGIYSDLGLEEISATKDAADEDVKTYMRAFDNQTFKVVKVIIKIADGENEAEAANNN